MRLTVVGKSPSWQDVDGACSGYLIEHEGTLVLLDCGNGVFGKLRRFVEYVDVSAVVLSHLHADHFLDLVPFSYALTYAPRQQPEPVEGWPGTDSPARPRLITPPGARKVFRRVVGTWGNEDLIENAFELEEYGANSVVDVGPMRFSFSPLQHFIDTYGISVTTTNGGGGRLAFGADSGPSEELVEFASGADLFLVEGTLTSPERGGDRGHMTPEEAGSLARSAGVKRMVLTHITDEVDQEDARRRASEAFGGAVEMASEGATFDL